MNYSIFRDLVEDTSEQRRTFFKLVFGSAKGYVCISYLDHNSRKMRKEFFEWPIRLEEMLANIEENSQKLVHAYFCPSLYGKPGNKHKEYITTCTNVWSDLDTCDPRHLLVPPSILTETSKGRYQALWLMEDPVEPNLAEDISRKIAYYHADQGADKSGWDLSQLLRIPYTPNYKYGDIGQAPIVTVLDAGRLLYRTRDFDRYPHVQALQKFNSEPEPISDENAEQVLKRYAFDQGFYRLFYTVPEDDWSGTMWALLKQLSEQDIPRADAFIIAWGANCNKYKRDGRPETELWRELDKAYIKQVEVMNLLPTAGATIPELITKEEIKLVQSRQTFVEKYITWASRLTDAAVQYHQSGAFMILSSLLSGNVKLHTNFGSIIPNLWFMLLGNTTLTRKTTAMNIAMKLLYEIDEQYLLATDSSPEGILVGMRDRPGQPSIFLRDEFAGLLEIIAHKDYMAGFAEQLTKLYDGEPLKRLLRKETIEIRDPVFLMYVGGPKSKTQMILTEDLVVGGFLPRFVIITAEPDTSRVQPMGPPIPRDLEEREFIKNELIDMRNHYVGSTNVVSNGETIGTINKSVKAYLSPEAWQRYNEFERLLTETALDTGLEYLTPVYDRLAKSTIKSSILIAASTQRGDVVQVTMQDLLHAIYYAREWRAYSNEIITGIGKTYDERIMDKIHTLVCSTEMGVSRAELMNIFKLDSKRADLLFKTMEQRRLIKLNNVNGERRFQMWM